MRRTRGFLAFLYDFIVGDDPLIAAFVVLALGATAAIAAADTPAWWVLPITVAAALTASVLRATGR